MARFSSKHLILIVIIMLACFIPTKRASADDPCPPGWFLGSLPSGTSPDNLQVCYFDWLNAGVTYEADAACDGEYMFLYYTTPGAGVAHIRIYPQENDPAFGGAVQVGFLAWFFGVEMEEDATPELLFEYINEDGQVLYGKSINLENYPYTWEQGIFGITPIIYRRYTVYFTTFPIGGELSSGHFRLSPHPDFIDVVPFLSSINIASFRVAGANHTLPQPCANGYPNPTATPIPETPTPGPTAPPTYTPTGTYATPTPTETGTPTMTPPIYVTSPIVTITPAPTITPPTFVAAPVPATPTPWPTIIMPTIAFPDVNLPVPDPLLPPEPADNSPATLLNYNLTDPIEMIATQWVDVINAPYEYLSITSTIGITTASGSIAYLVSPPTPVPGDFEYYAPTAVQDAVSTLSLVISLIKSVQIYFPVMWPTILAVLLAFGLILFTVIARFIVSWAVIILEWIRRVWEAIPLN